MDRDSSLDRVLPLDKQIKLDYKRSDVLLAMFMCSVFLRDIPMGYREKVVLCVIIMKFIDVYVKNAADIMWVDAQLKKMEKENYKDVGEVALCRSDSPERNRTSDE